MAHPAVRKMLVIQTSTQTLVDNLFTSYCSVCGYKIRVSATKICKISQKTFLKIIDVALRARQNCKEIRPKQIREKLVTQLDIFAKTMMMILLTAVFVTSRVFSRSWIAKFSEHFKNSKVLNNLVGVFPITFWERR